MINDDTESTFGLPVNEKKTWGSNLRLMWHHVSTYVALGYTLATGAWLSLDPLSQAAAMAVVPGLKWIAPATAVVAFVAAKGFPQKPKPAPDAGPETKV